MLVVVLVCEVGVRVMASRLPEPLLWYHPSAQIKIEQMDALAAAGTKVDVVLAGTSQMTMAVYPDEYAQLAAGHPVTYNAAVLAGYPSANHRYILEEILPRLHPKTVIYGVASEDFEPGPEAPYDEAPATEPGLLGSLGRWFSGRSELVDHRVDLRDPVVLSYAVSSDTGGGQLEHYRAAVVGPMGRWDDLGHLPCRTADGVVPTPPATPEVFVPDEGRIATVWSTVDAMRAQGIKVVIAVMPFADCYFDWFNRKASDAAGRARIAAGAAARGIPAIDVTADVHTNDLFGNTGHLNIDGAHRYTRLLAAAMGAQPSP